MLGIMVGVIEIQQRHAALVGPAECGAEERAAAAQRTRQDWRLMRRLGRFVGAGRGTAG